MGDVVPIVGVLTLRKPIETLKIYTIYAIGVDVALQIARYKYN